MRDVAVITPTREREANVRRLIGSVTATATGKTDLILAIDDDDATYDDMDLHPARVFRGPRQDVIGWTNAIAVQLAGEYRALASFGDDHAPHASPPGLPGWDERLLALLGGRPGVAYGNDLHRGEALATSWIVSSPVIAALGYMGPPGLIHLCMDLFAMQLGMDLENLAYLPDVIIEHHHHSAGKAPWDEGYARANAPSMYAHDNEAWYRFLQERWPGDLARLRGKLG